MKVINKRDEIVKKLKKIVKNSDVFYEKFFDGFHYTTTFHIITDKFRFYFKIDDEIMLNGDINALLRHVIEGYRYNMYSEVFNTKEYNKLYDERMVK